MQELDALKAAVPGFMRRKGRNRARITALEAAYEEYRTKAGTARRAHLGKCGYSDCSGGWTGV